MPPRRFHVPGGLVPTPAPEASYESASTRPLVFSQRVSIRPAEDSPAPYMVGDAPEDITLDDAVRKQTIEDLISFLQCGSPSTNDIGPFLKDDAERRSVAESMCQIVDHSLAVRVLFDALKRRDRSAEVTADGLLASCEEFIDSLKRKKSSLCREPINKQQGRLRGGLLGLEPNERRNEDYFNVQMLWNDNSFRACSSRGLWSRVEGSTTQGARQFNIPEGTVSSFGTPRETPRLAPAGISNNNHL